MQIDREHARQAFDAYVRAYDATNPRIKLKIDHTYRVAVLCARIARSLDLAPQEVDLAWLCGLLHDIGRFEQVHRFDTFSDAASVSHAHLGTGILFGQGVIRNFVDDGTSDELLRQAIDVHSDFRLPEGLDHRTRMFCDILRDADKIDILKAVCLEPTEAIIGVSDEELGRSDISPAALEAFYGHRTMLRSERSLPADHIVGFACFVFELVYPESRRIAHEQGRVFELLGRPFTNERTARQIAEMSDHVHAWLDSAAQ